MMSLPEAHVQLLEVAAVVQRLAVEHPGWRVERNQLRNWAILDEDGDQVGYIDVINGDVEVG